MADSSFFTQNRNAPCRSRGRVSGGDELSSLSSRCRRSPRRNGLTSPTRTGAPAFSIGQSLFLQAQLAFGFGAQPHRRIQSPGVVLMQITQQPIAKVNLLASLI